MKTRIHLFLLTIVSSFTILSAQELVNIIPKPQEMNIGKGVFVITSGTTVSISGDLHNKAEQLRNYLEPALGFSLAILSKPTSKNTIELSLNKELSELGEEGYRLNVKTDKVTISAFTSKGILWGIQTLRQLLPEQILRQATVNGIHWQIPCLTITDKPRFNWRGLMLDCSRTFIPKEQIKKYIDALSFFKMSVLHLHLTDDQGWRLQIKKYPSLTNISAKFHESFNEPQEYEGFYSQEDMKEIIAFAANRNILIVPEIEMPGHTTEVFAAFPDLSCKGDTVKIRSWSKNYGVTNAVFCAGNEDTFVFLQNVLDEVAELFPSPYIHIGGDEAPKLHWKECPKCQKRMVDEGLKNENELQSWFVKKIEKYINSKGKKLIGWDEIIEGGLSETATVMYWRSWQKDIAQKIPTLPNNIIMSPTSHSYFDYTYDKISTEKVYSFEPIPEGMTEKNSSKVLGVQANFWSHLDRTAPRMDKQLFPRILAMSEIAWTNKNQKEWSGFNIRLQSKLKSLSMMGVYFYTANQ